MVDTALLRDRRDELGLSNAELAHAAGGWSPGYVSNILSGTDEPGRKVLFGLCRALGLSIDRVATGGKRTPGGDPSEPPVQPRNEPVRPPTRRDTERERSAPSRVDQVAS